MKRIIRFLCFSLTVGVCLSAIHSVHAHGDEPRLEITPERVNPGGVVDLRGVDFEREEMVTLMLVNAQTAIPFGEVLADVDGVFLLNLTIPSDTPEGTYNFLAITDDHNITSPDLVVEGAPITGEEGGGQGLRDEDDPLLAPMPTFAPGVVPNDALSNQPTVQATQPAVQSLTKAEGRSMMSSVLILLGIGILVILGVRMVRKRK